MCQLHVPALMPAGKPECRQGLSHLPAAIPNQSPARGSSSVVTGGEYPDRECVSVWCDALYLQEYNIHKKIHWGLTQLAEPWWSPAIIHDIREMGCQLTPASCLYNTTVQQLLYAPCIRDCLEGKYTKYRIT